MTDKKNPKWVPQLLAWYDVHKRELPWRDCGDPYKIWVSEVMSQQTRIEAMKPYYDNWMRLFPTLEDLAKASEDEVVHAWQGLGYYSRANNLKRAAIEIEERFHGEFPRTYQEILSLPGIGEYTAGAIASIALGEAVPAIDGNVYRIYTRLFEDGSDITKAAFKRQLRSELLLTIPSKAPGIYNQAWMDLGATICQPNGAPLCDKCPFVSRCQAHIHDSWSAFPVKPPKKKRRIEEKTVILLEYQGTYLVQKRPPKGLLAGLWEFPSQEGFVSTEELQKLLEQWDTSASDIELLGKGKHIFSHIEWHMIGYLIHLKQAPSIPLSEDSIWVTAEKMQREYSIPSALRLYYSKIIS